jgi:hypothetical protein
MMLKEAIKTTNFQGHFIGGDQEKTTSKRPEMRLIFSYKPMHMVQY